MLSLSSGVNKEAYQKRTMENGNESFAGDTKTRL